MNELKFDIDHNGCHIVRNCKNGNGYGVVSRGGILYLAHRWQYMQHNGPIPDGMNVCHSCDNPPCINPAHLWLGTHADNARDRQSKGRTVNVNDSKTHCKRGHEFTPENTRIVPNGSRRCRACQTEYGTKYSRKYRSKS